MPRRGGGIAVRVLKSPGLHRFTWDLRYGTGAAESPRGGGGPMALPGKYLVRLTAGDLVETKPLELRLDPRVVADGVTQADLEEQLDFLLQAAAASADARATAARLAQAISRVSSQPGSDAATKTLRGLQAALVTASGPYPQPMLIDQLSSVSRMAGSADMKIGRSLFVYLAELKKKLEGIKGETRENRVVGQRSGSRARLPSVRSRRRVPPLATDSLATGYYRLFSTSTVLSFRTLPVLSVVLGSTRRTAVPSSATGWCSTPRGTMISSPGHRISSRSRKRIVSRPVTTRNSSSSASWWCHTNSPSSLASFTWTSFTSPTMRGLQRSSNELSFCARFTFSITGA